MNLVRIRCVSDAIWKGKGARRASAGDKSSSMSCSRIVSPKMLGMRCLKALSGGACGGKAAVRWVDRNSCNIDAAFTKLERQCFKVIVNRLRGRAVQTSVPDLTESVTLSFVPPSAQRTQPVAHRGIAPEGSHP